METLGKVISFSQNTILISHSIVDNWENNVIRHLSGLVNTLVLEFIKGIVNTILNIHNL